MLSKKTSYVFLVMLFFSSPLFTSCKNETQHNVFQIKLGKNCYGDSISVITSPFYDTLITWVKRSDYREGHEAKFRIQNKKYNIDLPTGFYHNYTKEKRRDVTISHQLYPSNPNILCNEELNWSCEDLNSYPYRDQIENNRTTVFVFQDSIINGNRKFATLGYIDGNYQDTTIVNQILLANTLVQCCQLEIKCLSNIPNDSNFFLEMREMIKSIKIK